MLIPPFVHDDFASLGFEIEPDALEQLATYLEMMLEVNQRMNLTAIREPDAAWSRHIVDSLTTLPGFEDVPDGSRIVDIGAGGGLPGIPLAIVLPHLRFTLIEATGKKAAFLTECVKTLGLDHVTVINDRAETVGQDDRHRQQYDIAICRAIGPMRELLEYALPLIKVGGLLLAMKGPKAEAELRDAGDALDKLGGGEVLVFDAYPEGFDLNTVIVSITKERPTPDEYPRRPGVPRQEPL